MDCLKLINAQQAKTTYVYKNMKEKLYRINGTIWFNIKTLHLLYICAL